MASDAGSNFAKTGFSSTTTAGTAIVGTHNTNGLSLGVPAFLTTAQAVGAYLTTGMLSNAGSNFLNTGTTGGTNASVTLASNGLSISVGNYITTGMLSNAGSNFLAASGTIAGTNITGTIGSNGISLSVASGGGAGDGYNIVQIGTIGTSGVGWSSLSATIGINGGGGVTVSQNGTNQIVVSAPGTSRLSALANLTIGTTGGTIGFSVGNYLTTGMASDAGSNFLAASGGFSGTNVSGTIASNGLRLSVAAPGGGAVLSSWFPYFPASTSSQTLGAMGTSTASAFVFPFVIDDAVAFNCINFLVSMSHVSSTASGRQSITSQFGIFSNNAGTLSLISSNSLSMALTGSSLSATISFPTSTATTGYAYGTTSATATADAQSLFGTAGNRIVQLQFGNSMTLAPGTYWLGLHQHQSTSSNAIGVSTAFVGNAMNGTTGVGPIGKSTAAYSASTAYHFGACGVFTSTGLANHSGTNLPGTMALTGFNNNINVIPLFTFMST
jgi:hypothetical protein